MTNQKATILLAEDEDTDAYFVQWATTQSGLQHDIVRVVDGQEAVDYLGGRPPFEDRARHPLPDLVLLDLRMPRLEGFDVLSWIKTRPELKEIPVVVLTSSQHPADMDKARALGAADYIVKPGNPKKLAQVMVDINTKWLAPISAEE